MMMSVDAKTKTTTTTIFWCRGGGVVEYTNGDETLFIYEQTDKTDRQTDTGRAMYFLRGIVSKKKVEQHERLSLSLFLSFSLFFGGDSSSSLWFGVFPLSFLESSSEESLFDYCL